MKDLAIVLENRPGALAEMGEALGRSGVSIEGGGAWIVDGRGAAHFLFHDGTAARRALEAAGIRVVEEREVLVQKLKQDVPGQLGLLTRRMAEADVNIEVLYSDHEHRLILIVDDLERGRAVSEQWWRESESLKERGKQTSPNRETIEKYMTAFEKGDRETLLSCLTDDVVWDLPGVFHLEGKISFEGEIRNDAFTGNPVITVTRMIEESDVVVAEGSVRTQKKTGEFVTIAFCDMFEMKTGKIQRLVSYLMEVKSETNNPATIGAGFNP